MKVLRYLSASVVLATLVVAGGRVAQAADAKTGVVTIDPKESKLYWLGKKVTGQHNGTVDVSGGELKVSGDQLTGGKVTIDATTITVLDLKDPKSNGSLTGHLKSPDFFDVEKHPEATFEVTDVKPIANAKTGEPNVSVEGNLTIKGMSHPLSFPALVTWKGKQLSVTAKDVVVDRTLYDIRYGSGKFFQGLGDKVIHDNFWIDLKLVGTKK